MGNRLYRSADDRMLAGVCAGIGDYVGTDPSLVRVLYALAAIMTGIVPLLIIYVVLAIVIPEEPAGFLSSLNVNPPAGTAADAWQAAQAGERAARREMRQAARAGRGGSDVALVFGAALVLVGVAFLVGPYLRIRWDLVWPIAVIALGGLVVVASLGRNR